jgi:hypothetical protein
LAGLIQCCNLRQAEGCGIFPGFDRPGYYLQTAAESLVLDLSQRQSPCVDTDGDGVLPGTMFRGNTHPRDEAVPAVGRFGPTGRSGGSTTDSMCCTVVRHDADDLSGVLRTGKLKLDVEAITWRRLMATVTPDTESLLSLPLDRARRIPILMYSLST